MGMRSVWAKALTVYLLCTAVAVIQLCIIYFDDNVDLAQFARTGPLTDKYALVVSLVSVWFLTGALLVLLWRGVIRRSNLLAYAGLVIIGLLYTNIMRERVIFGDVTAYIKAAVQTLHGEALHERYIYPPAWSSFLSVCYRVGGTGVVLSVCHLANLVSVWLFFILSSLILRRCGLSMNLAAVVVGLAMIVNVSMLRNLVYVQVNLLVASTILASILLYARFPLFSGFFLAIGAHLKVVPLVFVPLFLHRRKLKWLVSFVATVVAVVLLTSIPYGFDYYVSFFEKIRVWSETTFRSSSIHDFVLVTSRLITNSDGLGNAVNFIIHYALIFFTLWLAFLSVKRKSFVASGDDHEDRALNGLVPLSFLTVILPPTVWVHHLVLLIVPGLILSLVVHRRLQLILFCMGWYLTFMIPTFDFYPWSAARLAGWLILYAMVAAAVLGRWKASWPGIASVEIEKLLSGLQTRISQSVGSDPSPGR